MCHSAARRSLRALVPRHSRARALRYPPGIGPPAEKPPRASTVLPATSAAPENSDAESWDQIASSIHLPSDASPRDACPRAPQRAFRRTQSLRAFCFSRNSTTHQAQPVWAASARLVSLLPAWEALPISVRLAVALHLRRS